MKKDDRLDVIRKILELSKEDCIRSAEKFAVGLNTEDGIKVKDYDALFRRVVDECPTLREAAFAGAAGALAIINPIDENPTMEYLQNQRDDLLLELASVTLAIVKKGQVEISERR